MLIKILSALYFVSLITSAYSQSQWQAYKPQLFTTPLAYQALQTDEKITVDGSLSEKDWQNASWSDLFTDIEGNTKPKPAFNTQIKMLWNDTCLYIAAQLKEPHLNASLHQHDTILFYDNDFEIFIDPDNDTHQYFEIEVNALNTIFDLFMPKPYRNGGDALIGYDIQGLQSAVQLHGTLNKSDDTDTGWTVEMSIPFRALNFGFKKSYTPAAGSFYRISFSRVEWDWNIINGRYVKRRDSAGRSLPEHNWVWSSQGVINMHYPERWGYVFFNKNASEKITIPAAEKAKNYLWLVYYKQHDYYEIHKRYAKNLSLLKVPSTLKTGNPLYRLSLTALDEKFIALASDETSKQGFSINEEGKVEKH